jgi:hypothetical protein
MNMDIYHSIIPEEGSDVVMQLNGDGMISLNNVVTNMNSNTVNASLECKLFMHSGINYICIYNVVKYKSDYVDNKPQIDKLKILNTILTKLTEYTELTLDNNKYVISVAITGDDEEELNDIMKKIPYNSFIRPFGSCKNKEDEVQRLCRAYKKEIVDVYELFDFKSNESLGIAYVNDMQTSSMMTYAFAKMQEKSLAMIEDSDDEDGDGRELRYINVWCKYLHDKNAWTPVSIKNNNFRK